MIRMPTKGLLQSFKKTRMNRLYINKKEYICKTLERSKTDVTKVR